MYPANIDGKAPRGSAGAWGDGMASVRARVSGWAASVVSAAFVSSALLSTAQAQNYPGDGQLRFGAFVQGQLAPATASLPSSDSKDLHGGGVGASLGFDWNLYQRWIVGIEADGVATDAGSRITNGTYNSDYFANFRGRVGYRYNPQMLIYGTAGVAFHGIHFRGPGQPTQTNPDGLFKISTTLPGFVIGSGVEYDWHGMKLFGEYLFASYEPWDFTGGLNTRYSLQSDEHMFRLGVKFVYGHDHYIDDVKRPRRY
jgi:opacity protein-like surface antigen